MPTEQSYHILVINPGSTSTKVALFQDEALLHKETLRYDAAELAPFPRIADQYAFRRDSVLQWLQGLEVKVSDLNAVVGRGGLFGPLESGTYRVNEAMLEEMRHPVSREHASNLGVLIAHEIAGRADAPAFTVDPVSVDEFPPVARLSGLAEIERKSLSHALNIKAVARRAAAAMGQCYPDLNLVVAHLGGGISVTAHRRGRMVDVNNALDAGPFSPERCGTLPLTDLIELCYSGRFEKPELKKHLIGRGGLVSHLGTNSALEVERRIAAGDQQTLLVAQAMAYNIAKEIGAMATVLQGDVDAIVITGGVAHWQDLLDWIEQRVSFIAPVMVYPGEVEMLALAQGALRVLQGQERAKDYVSRQAGG
ncbi:MAG: butyrate kinase [Chloroflexia bacterium]|nr:butyrate kinase [Chloroflexia bacterium]